MKNKKEFMKKFIPKEKKLKKYIKFMALIKRIILLMLKKLLKMLFYMKRKELFLMILN